MKKINVIVVGTGMYVCGRETDGYGTIAPALLEWSRTGALGKLYIVGRTAKGSCSAMRKIEKLKRDMGIDLPVEYFPQRGFDPKYYRKIMQAIPKPAAAIIAVPDGLHKEVAIAAIKRGLPSLVVKPLVPTVRDVLDLVKLQGRYGVHCAVEFHKRFDEANLKLRDALESGKLGDPLYFLVEYSQRKSVPAKHFKKWAATTNIFQYLGIHYVDIVHFVTGATPVRAMAVGQKNWLLSSGINTYDSIEAIVEWKMPSGKKFVSNIISSWIDPDSTSAMSDQKIKVVGTKGRFESDQKRRGIMMVTDDKGMEEPNPYFCCSYGAPGKIEYRGYGIDSIHRFLDDVVDIEAGKVSLKSLEADRPTFRQSLAPTAVLEAVNKSLARNGHWISIKDIYR